jgi:hypothetical protein
VISVPKRRLRDRRQPAARARRSTSRAVEQMLAVVEQEEHLFRAEEVEQGVVEVCPCGCTPSVVERFGDRIRLATAQLACAT